ncbi:MAG: stimulus-sensing domain-containing protein [Alphaproteobacteria bacterium]
MKDADQGGGGTEPRRSRGGRRFSSLTWRILAINLLALGIVVVGMLYLDTYRRGLIEARTAALKSEGEMMAGALSEIVVTTGDGALFEIDAGAARQMLRRLVVPIHIRARLFDTRGVLIADSSRLPGAAPLVESEELPPPVGAFEAGVEAVYAWVVSHLPPREKLEPYVENERQRAADYHEAMRALAGYSASALHDGGKVGTILSVAVPVQRFKQLQGALLLSTTIDDVEDSVRAVRYAILKIFALALSITIALSVFLAGTIARPVRRLAEAADAVRHGHSRAVVIPDFSGRRDEIGDLSRALGDMTDALADRIDAIERFAADVAHEIKNPLGSLRSAVETVVRIEDPEQQRKLLAIVREDVQRLDRLISDISDASRLDAELARAETVPVDLGRMLSTLVEVQRAIPPQGDPAIVLDLDPDTRLVVPGFEGRLAQVFENLINNARSFSPPGGVIRIAAWRDDDAVAVTVEDDGPGIPPAKLEAIFDRFYSERPATEKFGTHSGLGLSISRQIVEAHGGVIRTENRGDGDRARGARFIVRLPL